MRKTDDYREKALPVPPDSVRVSWWYRAQNKSRNGYMPRDKFEKYLGEMFIPGWVQFTAPIGLTSYYPSLVPVDDCLNVPDETAIVFFESQSVYRNKNKTNGGRLSGYALHQVVFDMDKRDGPKVSKSDFPDPMGSKIKLNKPYYLLDRPADWFMGFTDHYVGVYTDSHTQDEFLVLLRKALSSLKENTPAGLSGLIFVVLSDTLLVWANWEDSDSKERPGLLSDIKKILRTVLDARCTKIDIPQNISDVYPGVNVQAGTAYDARFRRRKCYSQKEAQLRQPPPEIAKTIKERTI